MPFSKIVIFNCLLTVTRNGTDPTYRNICIYMVKICKDDYRCMMIPHVVWTHYVIVITFH